jgi:hypothetical protein
MSKDEAGSGSDWWGRFELERGSSGCWKIGPGTFWVQRMNQEWRVIYNRGDDPQALETSVQIPSPEDCRPGDGGSLTRIGAGGTLDSITVKPALADKPVVIRPDDPFYVMPGEKTTMYVATPLWFQLYRGKTTTKIYDQPVYQPSLTWFGPDTMTGELCYASRVFGRLEFDEIMYRPHRAYTAILIKNESSESVLIERFNLPVPHLTLYKSGKGHLWTQRVTLEILGGVVPSELKLGGSAADQTGPLHQVAEPRDKTEQKILSRALNFLIN